MLASGRHSELAPSRQGARALERDVQKRAAMLLRSPLQLLLPVLLQLGCARVPAAHVSPAAAPPSLGYFTIEPDVSVSRSALPYEEPRMAVDPNADVMAEILAVPSGSPGTRREPLRAEAGALASFRPNYAPWPLPSPSAQADAR